MTPRRIIKEYIRCIIKEDDGGGYDFSSMYDNPYGPSFGGKNIFKIFIDPFVDVFETGKAVLSTISTKVRTLAKVIFTSMVSMAIPAMEVNYDKIYEKEKESIAKIQQKYGDVFERTNKAFRDNDAFALALFIDPVTTIAASSISKIPGVASETLEIFTGTDYGLRKLFKSKFGKNESFSYDLRLINEDADTKLARILLNPKVSKRINNLPLVKSIRKDAFNVAKNMTNNIYRNFLKIENAKKLNDIKNILNIQDDKNFKEFEILPQNERDILEKEILQQIKESTKKFYSMKIESYISSLKKAGIRDEHTLVKLYNELLDSITRVETK